MGKRRNCSLRAISPFFLSVFKRHVLQTRKNQGLFGKGLINLIASCLRHSTLFQLYRGAKFTFPCSPGVSFVITPHNSLSKPLAAFPHHHSRWTAVREKNQPCRNDNHRSSDRNWQRRGSNQLPLFSSSVSEWLRSRYLFPWTFSKLSFPNYLFQTTFSQQHFQTFLEHNICSRFLSSKYSVITMVFRHLQYLRGTIQN